MRNKIMIALLGATLLLAACGDKTETPTQAPAAVEETNVEETNVEETEETTGDTSKVADASDMSEVVDVVEEGMVPIYADSLKEGVYPLEVSSSSGMFKIESAELTVKDGQMMADMTMGGTGYLYVFMGTGEQAAASGEESYISFEEDADGKHHFTVPVEALDMGINCAAFSKKKEMWYDRTLVFRADSLPLDSYADGVIVTASDLGLEDGEYTVDVTLEGGSGKTSVESPARIHVAGGEVTATIVLSSKNYDYMLVGGERYDNETPGEQSSFTIPIAGFDCKLPVVGDTTAMSQPYEIDYTLYFDSQSIQKAE